MDIHMAKNDKFLKKFEESKLSKIELAEKAGVKRESIYNVIKGSMPRVGIAIKIAKALGCTVEDIFEK